MKLCSFFNAISQKVADPMKLTKLQYDLILVMCNLETIFPPSFFDLMPHILVHIVHKMKYMGPVCLHQIYPFERFMTVLKKYVHNQSHPEGCMVQGWAIEEVIVLSLFCAMKGTCLGKGHEVTLLSVLIMSHTHKHISQFYNNLFQSLPMSACMSKCCNPVI
jgi:hypothetical protein